MSQIYTKFVLVEFVKKKYMYIYIEFILTELPKFGSKDDNIGLQKPVEEGLSET